MGAGLDRFHCTYSTYVRMYAYVRICVLYVRMYVSMYCVRTNTFLIPWEPM